MNKKYFLLLSFIPLLFAYNTRAVSPSDFGLKEGDMISAIFSKDPDVYIINEWGYKRLFLNPTIFNFYGQLGTFANVKVVTPEIRDAFTTSGYFRDCESNDPKVYGIEVTGEDSGELRWIDVSGTDAIQSDPNFFKKVFCINNKEFDWYPQGNPFTAVTEVPNYLRNATASSSAEVTPLVSISPVPLASSSFSPTPTPAFTATPTPLPTPTPVPTPPPTPNPTPVPPTSTCLGGDGRVPGLPTCLMPENLAGTGWNEVDNSTGKVIGGAVCSVAVCGRDGEWKKLRNANNTYYPNGYPPNATYIQTPFNVSYGGYYYTNGVWQISDGGIIQPSSSQITYLTPSPTPTFTITPPPQSNVTSTPTPTPAPSSNSYSPTPTSTPTSTPTPTPTPDTAYPVVSSVQVSSITTNSAVITWTTDEPATGFINYGSTANNWVVMPNNTSYLTSHSSTLSGLTASTVYTFRVYATDASGNSIPGYPPEHTFTTGN